MPTNQTPIGFKKLRPGQMCWGRRGDLIQLTDGKKWRWVGMCSFRVSKGQTVITPNKRNKTLRRGDLVDFLEKDGSTFGLFFIVTAIFPENSLCKGRFDSEDFRRVTSIETLTTDGAGMPNKYAKKFGWNLVDMPELFSTAKQLMNLGFLRSA